MFARSRARLEALWEELHIPLEEREQFAQQFFEPASPANHAHIALQARSISRLLEHRSATLEVLKSIDVREALINKLQHLASMLVAARHGEADSSVIGTQVGESVRALRAVTVEATEAILAWRRGLTRPYPFMWRGENYLLKMRHDLDWIVESDLFVLISYATPSNPLLLPRDAETGRAARKHLSGLSDLDMQRMRAAERTILDEAEVQQRRVAEESAEHGPVPRSVLRMVAHVGQPTSPVLPSVSSPAADGRDASAPPAHRYAADASEDDADADAGDAEADRSM